MLQRKMGFTHESTRNETQEWYTPPEYIEAAREVMGGIGLDPASTKLANGIVQADVFFTIGDDGLSRPWNTRSVFLNCPYGKTKNKSNQEVWSRKMLTEYALGNFGQAVFLSKTVHGYSWYNWLFCDVRPTVCITRDRIAFIKPEWIRTDNSIDYPKKGDLRSKAASSFWYIGEDDGKFTKVFSRFGRVIHGDCTRV